MDTPPSPSAANSAVQLFAGIVVAFREGDFPRIVRAGHALLQTLSDVGWRSVLLHMARAALGATKGIRHHPQATATATSGTALQEVLLLEYHAVSRAAVSFALCGARRDAESLLRTYINQRGGVVPSTVRVPAPPSHHQRSPPPRASGTASMNSPSAQARLTQAVVDGAADLVACAEDLRTRLRKQASEREGDREEALLPTAALLAQWALDDLLGDEAAEPPGNATGPTPSVRCGGDSPPIAGVVPCAGLSPPAVLAITRALSAEVRHCQEVLAAIAGECAKAPGDGPATQCYIQDLVEQQLQSAAYAVRLRRECIDRDLTSAFGADSAVMQALLSGEGSRPHAAGYHQGCSPLLTAPLSFAVAGEAAVDAWPLRGVTAAVATEYMERIAGRVLRADDNLDEELLPFAVLFTRWVLVEGRTAPRLRLPPTAVAFLCEQHDAITVDCLRADAAALDPSFAQGVADYYAAARTDPRLLEHDTWAGVEELDTCGPDARDAFRDMLRRSHHAAVVEGGILVAAAAAGATSAAAVALREQWRLFAFALGRRLPVLVRLREAFAALFATVAPFSLLHRREAMALLQAAMAPCCEQPTGPALAALILPLLCFDGHWQADDPTPSHVRAWVRHCGDTGDDASLQGLLRLCTGAPGVPLDGLHKPIDVVHIDGGGVFGRTCFFELLLPTLPSEAAIADVLGAACGLVLSMPEMGELPH